MHTTTAMAADLSGVPQRTIQRWAAEGRITSEIRAGDIHVNAAEVEELAEHRYAGRLPRIDARSRGGASLPHRGCAVSSAR